MQVVDSACRAGWHPAADWQSALVVAGFLPLETFPSGTACRSRERRFRYRYDPRTLRATLGLRAGLPIPPWRVASWKYGSFPIPFRSAQRPPILNCFQRAVRLSSFPLCAARTSYWCSIPPMTPRSAASSFASSATTGRSQEAQHSRLRRQSPERRQSQAIPRRLRIPVSAAGRRRPEGCRVVSRQRPVGESDGVPRRPRRPRASAHCSSACSIRRHISRWSLHRPRKSVSGIRATMAMGFIRLPRSVRLSATLRLRG